MSKVVHFPRHLSTPPSRPLSLPEQMERRYEREIGEPWSKLKESVRARHPEFFAMYDAMEREPAPKQAWWGRLLDWRRGPDQ